MKSPRTLLEKNNCVDLLDIPVTEFLLFLFLPFNALVLPEQQISRVTSCSRTGELVPDSLHFDIGQTYIF